MENNAALYDQVSAFQRFIDVAKEIADTIPRQPGDTALLLQRVVVADFIANALTSAVLSGPPELILAILQKVADQTNPEPLS